MQWAATGNKTYSALAIGTDGTRPFCNTSGSACTIQGLRCGRTYAIAVTTSNIQCIIQGSDLQIQTGTDFSEKHRYAENNLNPYHYGLLSIICLYN